MAVAMHTSKSGSKSDVVRFQQVLDHSRHVVNVPLLLLRQTDVRQRQNEHRQQTCPAFPIFLRQENVLSQRHQLTDIVRLSNNRASKEAGYLVGNCIASSICVARCRCRYRSPLRHFRRGNSMPIRRVRRLIVN